MLEYLNRFEAGFLLDFHSLSGIVLIEWKYWFLGIGNGREGESGEAHVGCIH